MASKIGCLLAFTALMEASLAWTTSSRIRQVQSRLGATDLAMSGSLHGQDACFLPLKQLDQDYYAPRIIQVSSA